MLTKGTDIIGLKIISIKEGKEINKIEDLIYDPDTKQIKALITDSFGLFSGSRFLLPENIKNIGKNAVIIESVDALKKITEIDEKIANIAKDNTYITKTKVVTEEGTGLGYISDIIFDTSTGNVEKFEVSQGLKDIQSGRKYININDIITIGKDVIIVKTSTQEKISEQAETGDVQESLSRTRNLADDVTEKGEKVSQEVSEKAEEVRSQVEKLKDTAKSKIEEVQSTVEEKRINSIIGRYLTINILSASDEIIARRGEIITHHLIEEAEKNNVLNQVLNNNTDEPLDM